MTTEQNMIEQLASLHAKIDALTTLVEEAVGAKKKKAAAKKEKSKPAPLTAEEISVLQSRFNDLFSRYLANQESTVHEELEALTPEELRRFADANNLNVTAKTPKARVIQLIGFRFREKKQLSMQISRPS